jgi:hypothetical protein
MPQALALADALQGFEGRESTISFLLVSLSRRELRLILTPKYVFDTVRSSGRQGFMSCTPFLLVESSLALGAKANRRTPC